MSQSFFRFALEYAESKKDTTFQARLCLALARSFFTSTRFELAPTFAKEMFLRGHYLMEKMVGHKAPWTSFRIPEHIFSV